ncbi:MAG: glucose 1-dehydrogenase [Alphaproteobacteria bacterium]|nr:glucose 1-dehydrogenase [Alphaproteobacteria bacterium]
MTRAFDLKGKVAVVTGGNGGIGLGMARGMAEAGAAIVVAGRNAQKNEAAVATLKGGGATASSVIVDVNDEKQCAAMVAHAVQRHGGLDILVNNAGINVRKPPHEISVAEWTLVLNTNLTSAMVCSQIAYPEMKKRGGGKVINIGSMMSIFGAAYTPAYAASKGGIVQFTKVCATAWAKDNIQVNAVLPGWIDTELTSNARREVPGLHDRVLSRTPAGRWGTPQDMAGIAVFLASPASDFVTGASIPVDGGYAVLG